MRIRPRLHDNGRGYLTSFRHPFRDKKVVKGWLSTRDEKTAWSICRELEQLCSDPSNWTTPNDPKHAGNSTRALEIFFGDEVGASRTVENPDGEAVLRLLLGQLRQKGYVSKGKIDLSPDASIASILGSFHELEKRVSKAEGEALRLRDELEMARAEAHRMGRKYNVHVKETVAQAAALWKEIYPRGHAERTVTDAIRAVENFVEWIGANTKLAAVTGGKIEEWVGQLKNMKDLERAEKDPGVTVRPVEPPTARKYKAYLSTFLTWAFRKYDLSENPMEKSGSVAGLSRHPDSIVAIRRLDQLKGLFEALAPKPYWRAWVALACLAGPRYTEQAQLRIEDVFLEEGYIRIVAPKTGRERRVPIEKTVLHKILVEHLATREQERKTGTTAAERSDFVFPSTLPENELSPRRKTENGPWSDNRSFKRAWWPVAQELGGRAGVWAYGPAEWRRTFGTTLGMCRYNSLEISRLMGNSEMVCQRYYVSKVRTGKGWGFKW